MKTLASTFEVSSVSRATNPLPEVSFPEAIFHRLSQPLQQTEGQLVTALEQEKLSDLEEELSDLRAHESAARRSIEACSRYHGRLVANVSAHPVMVSLHHAFTQHRPLCFSPDGIWLLICQGVAHHINVQAENLRSRFVRHEGKVAIKVRRDDFVKGSPENPWGGVIDEISLTIREHIGPSHGLFVPRFSTTGPTERIAAEIVLLDAMQSYFEYGVFSTCGIPAITLEGTAGDWQELAERAQAFAEFGLDWWLTPLQPILQEFVAAARGDVRRSFWESIYKFDSFSGGDAITGWIATFFPYLNDQHGNPTKMNSWLADGGADLMRLLSGKWDRRQFDRGSPTTSDFPTGLSRAPFVWTYYEKRIDMEFVGGFVGVAQDSTTLALTPEIGWAIRCTA